MAWIILAIAAACFLMALRTSGSSFRALQARSREQQRDIDAMTARVAKAEAEARQSQRLAELGTLTGGLAHEIKNPLSTVGLNLQLLAEDLSPDDPSTARFQHRLATVQRETNRLRDILDDFLRFAGKLELSLQRVSLNQILEELVDFFAPQAQQARVRMRLNMPDEPLFAEIDEKTIKQTVLNLMINAVQAMNGGGELILALSQCQDQACIDVIDTGPGIAPDAVDKVFQAYYSTKRGGTGLGLAMAQRIALEHGGSLTVQSTPGKGSDFSLKLPLQAAAHRV